MFIVARVIFRACPLVTREGQAREGRGAGRGGGRVGRHEGREREVVHRKGVYLAHRHLPDREGAYNYLVHRHLPAAKTTPRLPLGDT